VAVAQDLTSAIISTDLQHLHHQPSAALHQLAAIFSDYQPLPPDNPLAGPLPLPPLLPLPEPQSDPLIDPIHNPILPYMQDAPLDLNPPYPADFPRVPELLTPAILDAVYNPLPPVRPQTRATTNRNRVVAGFDPVTHQKNYFSHVNHSVMDAQTGAALN
jgi:hypothetical protein